MINEVEFILHLRCASRRIGGSHPDVPHVSKQAKECVRVPVVSKIFFIRFYYLFWNRGGAAVGVLGRRGGWNENADNIGGIELENVCNVAGGYR